MLKIETILIIISILLIGIYSGRVIGHQTDNCVRKIERLDRVFQIDPAGQCPSED